MTEEAIVLKDIKVWKKNILLAVKVNTWLLQLGKREREREKNGLGILSRYKVNMRKNMGRRTEKVGR